MRTALLTLASCCLALVALPAVARSQEAKPGPEHQKLKKFEGDWDATVSFMGSDSKATATYKMDLGGLWLFLSFHGEFAGQKFEGRGTTGYDPIKKKYVGTWVDSMSPSLTVTEGAFGKDGKTYTETAEGIGMDGKPMKMKWFYEFKDADTLLFTMYSVNDGKDQEMFKISYKRKK
jgi:hypothetical protein